MGASGAVAVVAFAVVVAAVAYAVVSATIADVAVIAFGVGATCAYIASCAGIHTTSNGGSLKMPVECRYWLQPLVKRKCNTINKKT